MVARRRAARGLLRDRRGAAALEFSFVASAFLLLVLLIFEVAWQSAVAAALDRGAREAGRWASLGQAAPTAAPRESWIREVIAQGSGIQLGETLQVRMRSYASFAEAGTAAAAEQARCPAPQAGSGGGAGGGAAASLGGPRQVVRYDVSYDSLGLTAIGRNLLRSALGREFLFHCVVFVTLNEPFPED